MTTNDMKLKAIPDTFLLKHPSHPSQLSCYTTILQKWAIIPNNTPQYLLS